MHLILFLIGTVVAFAGALLVLYAVPVVDVAAAALFTSGVFAIVGALILMALAAVARSVSRIAERLEVQPLSAPAVPPVATITREEPPPRPARAEPAQPAPAAPPADASAVPSGKKASPLTAWLNRMTPASAPAKPSQPAEEPVAPDDLALLAKMPEEPPPMVAPAPIEPANAAPATAAAPPPPPAPSPPPPAAPPAPAAPLIPRAVTPASRPVPRSPAPVPTAPEATVYKSGVIDGMAYTLFMDGSIEAELPQGRVRFGSVDELQKYLTNRP